MGKKKPVKKSNIKNEKMCPSTMNTIKTEVSAMALSAVKQPVFLKVCRLCEGKDGPFLNIFEADKVIAKKIDTVMPFKITENDDLPHKICFRCSAKVEELYEFIQRCIRTQENLRNFIGSNTTKESIPKAIHRELWEETLNSSNISNDDICDALIKKAMEGIKDMPLSSLLNPVPTETESSKKSTKTSASQQNKKQAETSSDIINDSHTDDEPLVALKITKTEVEDKIPVKRPTRSCTEKKMDVNEVKVNENVKSEETPKSNQSETKSRDIKIEESKIKVGAINVKQSLLKTNHCLDEPIASKTEQNVAKTLFDIMDHISTIKVNGVGTLFQCKICNRNFLKKSVVLSHACAKQGGVKVQRPVTLPSPAPPKLPQTVKYITTKVNKESITPIVDVKSKTLEIKKTEDLNAPINLDDDDEDDKPLVPKKPKPRIGPASKVKRVETNTSPVANVSLASISSSPATPVIPGVNVNIPPNVSNVQIPSVQFPTIPSLNSRYKLMPGPNNTFTLIEEKSANPKTTEPETSKIIDPKTTINVTDPKPSDKELPVGKLELASEDRPYPVGLISTNNSRIPTREPVAFQTPAMKKQSYTVVQTGNPSKLVISTKPSNTPEEEVPKKRAKKIRIDPKESSQKQPFSVTLEYNAPPPPDPGFFTFINVDPLMQPHYVLPTDNIQESQISTSTKVNESSENKYTCNICNEKFSREKKLLAHIQSHYSKMDEEDQQRAQKNPKKRSRK